eukprot:g7403.t1
MLVAEIDAGQKFSWKVNSHSGNENDIIVEVPLKKVNHEQHYRAQISSAVQKSGHNDDRHKGRQVTQWSMTAVVASQGGVAWTKVPIAITGDFGHVVQRTVAIDLPKDAEDLFEDTSTTTVTLADCTVPEVPEGFHVTETSLHIDGFQVAVECAEGYVGDPKSEPCEHPGQAYRISGCTWSNLCVAPKDLDGYIIQEVSLQADNFKVIASCSAKDGYHGEAVVTGCDKQNNRYSVSGCRGFVCSAPADVVGYVLTETDLKGDTFDVQATCADGFNGVAKEAPVRVNELFLDYFYSGQSWSKPNETMAQRIVRRETTFVWLKEASPETALSDNLKCMLLLIFSGLEPSILASVGDEYDYKKVSHVRVQFPTSLSFARTTCALAAAVSSSTEARWKQFPQRQKQVLAAEIDDEFHTGKMMTMPRRMTPTLAISTMRASTVFASDSIVVLAQVAFLVPLSFLLRGYGEGNLYSMKLIILVVHLILTLGAKYRSIPDTHLAAVNTTKVESDVAETQAADEESDSDSDVATVDEQSDDASEQSESDSVSDASDASETDSGDDANMRNVSFLEMSMKETRIQNIVGVGNVLVRDDVKEGVNEFCHNSPRWTDGKGFNEDKMLDENLPNHKEYDAKSIARWSKAFKNSRNLAPAFMRADKFVRDPAPECRTNPTDNPSGCGKACVFCMQAADGDACPAKSKHNDISKGIGLSQAFCGGGDRNDCSSSGSWAGDSRTLVWGHLRSAKSPYKIYEMDDGGDVFVKESDGESWALVMKLSKQLAGQKYAEPSTCTYACYLFAAVTNCTGRAFVCFVKHLW